MPKKPNFLLVVADDLGYSDIGCFGGEIRTPNLDRLASEGVRFSDFHTAPACSPTRSMIMSGTDCHLAGLGVMYEHRSQDPERWNVPGHEGYLNYDVAAMPDLLADAGYWNAMSGKWHLGYREQHLPHSRGFHQSFSLLPGCSNHYGWEPAYTNGDANLPRVVGHQPPIYVENGRKVQPEPNVSNSPSGFYSSDFFADKLVEQLHGRDEESKAKPFFAYLAFSAPHWPLQCMAHDRDMYKGVYDDGPHELRKRRLRRLVDLGLIKQGVVPHAMTAKVKDWEDLTASEQTMSARAMEVYAGMVTAMDRAMGRVLDYLEEIGELDNTVIIFMSDNGAEGAALEASPVMGVRVLDTIDKYYDNSYENLGNHDSFCWYGPLWAQASTAPSRLMKTFVTEGGIRVPLIVRYPGFTRYQPGSICHAFATCMDILPTFLSMANGTHPNSKPAHPRERAPYRGHMVYPMRGISWTAYLTKKSSAIHTEDDAAVGWEAHGRASLRKGVMKIVHIPKGHLTGTGAWQMYDLSTDQGETNDLALRYPDKLRDMLNLWQKYQDETGTIFGPPIKGGKNTLLTNQIGGDPMDDQKIWMYLGVGARFTDHDLGRERLHMI